jgi:hypothetical protein
MDRKILEDLATRLLRKNNYTWAGNDKNNPEFKTIIGNRKLEAEAKIPGGMSSKKPGRICPKGKGGIIY